MRRSSALDPFLVKPLSAPIAILAWLVVSLAAPTDNVNQHGSMLALPSDPIPSSSLSASSVCSNPDVLQLPDTNHSLSLIENFTASIQFHIPDSPIDLTFTRFGSPLVYRTLCETIGLALDEISTNVALYPTESIRGGFFRQGHEGLEIKIYEYVGKEITWYLLDLILLGIQYWSSRFGRSCEIWFHIDVQDEGRVGYGSLWDMSIEGANVAKRAVNDTSQQLSIISNSGTAQTNSTDSSLSPIPSNSQIALSYHFFGSSLPKSEFSACFRDARRSIRADTLRHPFDPIPDSSFEYRVDHSPVSVSVEAYAGKEISWQLLDRILRDVNADLMGERHLRECEFEFEIDLFEEAYGYGYLRYDPEDSDFFRQTRSVDGAARNTIAEAVVSGGYGSRPMRRPALGKT